MPCYPVFLTNKDSGGLVWWPQNYKKFLVYAGCYGEKENIPGGPKKNRTVFEIFETPVLT